MKRALIGYTGFVGASLLAAGGFSHGFNRADAEEARGIRFDEVVVAAMPCLAAHPDDADDAQAVAALAALLEGLTAQRCVLLSSAELFEGPGRFDETAAPAPSRPAGLRRLQLEQRVVAHFPASTLVRLPGLFGEGLKANALADLLAGRAEAIDPAAQGQWYPLRRLPADLARISGAGLALTHLAPAPIAFSEILARHFPGLAATDLAATGRAAPTPELTTRHAALFGGEGDYTMSTSQALAALGDFLKQRRRAWG